MGEIAFPLRHQLFKIRLGSRQAYAQRVWLVWPSVPFVCFDRVNFGERSLAGIGWAERGEHIPTTQAACRDAHDILSCSVILQLIIPLVHKYPDFNVAVFLWKTSDWSGYDSLKLTSLVLWHGWMYPFVSLQMRYTGTVFVKVGMMNAYISVHSSLMMQFSSSTFRFINFESAILPALRPFPSTNLDTAY